jgi:hypothetical protein
MSPPATRSAVAVSDRGLRSRAVGHAAASMLADGAFA